MPKDHVVINNVTLTRAQIEQAVKDLAKPENLKGGTILVYRRGGNEYRYVVVHPSVRANLTKVMPETGSTIAVAISFSTGIVAHFTENMVGPGKLYQIEKEGGGDAY